LANSVNNFLVCGFNPLKNISQLGLLLPIYGKIKNVPNHQPALLTRVYGDEISIVSGLTDQLTTNKFVVMSESTIKTGCGLKQQNLGFDQAKW